MKMPYAMLCPLICLALPPGAAVADDTAAASEAGVEVLTRGPVHEAFAEPAFSGRNEGLMVPKQPPQAIEEMPPDARPEGENVLWIPGYWAWEPDRNDFLWVSGLWRATPPGQSWMPGYWLQVEGGARWVSGFWSSVDQQQQEVTYLPEPPESLEQGPSAESPGANYFWTPGVWIWRDARYAWRPGYWAPVQANWIWVPDRYCWAPRGWIYLSGYWDYPVASRGLLFSPVFFTQPVYSRPNYLYTPAVVVDVSVLTSQMFCWPRYHHYCFGDWYAPHWEQRGIYPWYTYQQRRLWYDPLFVYYRWDNHRRGNEHWERDMRRWNDYFRDHPDMRPPHTLAQQRDLRGRVRDEALLRQLTVARPLGELRGAGDSWVRLGAVSQTDRKRFAEGSRGFADFGRQRQTLEGRGITDAGRIRPLEKPETLRLPTLPNLDRAAGRAARQDAAGKIPQRPGERTEPVTRRPKTDLPGPQGPKPPSDARSRISEQPGLPGVGTSQGDRPRTFDRPDYRRDTTPSGDRMRSFDRPGGTGQPPSGDRSKSIERRDQPGGGKPQADRSRSFDRSGSGGQSPPQGDRSKSIERRDQPGGGTPQGDRKRSFDRPNPSPRGATLEDRQRSLGSGGPSGPSYSGQAPRSFDRPNSPGGTAGGATTGSLKVTPERREARMPVQQRPTSSGPGFDAGRARGVGPGTDASRSGGDRSRSELRDGGGGGDRPGRPQTGTRSGGDEGPRGRGKPDR